MARRVAINIGQRTGANGIRGRGRLSKRPGQAHSMSNSSKMEKPSMDNRVTSVPDKTNDSLSLNTNTYADIDTPLKDNSLLFETTRGKKMFEVHEKEDDPALLVDIKGVMGFDNFATTKNKHVKGTDCYGIKFKQTVEYRQYMNREGGFNRELSPTRNERKKIKMSLKTNPSKT